jgi:hypothetical protein
MNPKREVDAKDYTYYVILERNRWTAHKPFMDVHSTSYEKVKEEFDFYCRTRSKFSNNYRIVKVFCTNV